MEFADLIYAPKLESAVLVCPFCVKIEGSLCITGHHLIASSKTEDNSEILV